MSVLHFIKTYWKALIIILTPVLLLPLPIVPLIPIQAAKCAYIVCIMAVFWASEVIPLPTTAFLPVVLYPLFGLVDGKTVAVQYLNDSNFVFIGSIILAVGIEESRLHKRIALKTLLLMGSDLKWVMLGLQLATAFLSMWMSNTATTAMMMPIVVAVIKELAAFKRAEEAEVLNQKDPGEEPPTIEDVDILSRPAREVKMYKGLLLSICFSANIGGTGTLTGTGSNIVLSGMLGSFYPDQTDLSFATWMAFSFPQVVVLLILSWLLLYIMFIGISNRKTTGKSGVHQVIRQKYDDMGKMSFFEIEMVVCLLVLVILWLTRDPKFVNGWGSLFREKFVTDGTSAMLVGVLLFFLPRNAPKFLSKSKVYDLPNYVEAKANQSMAAEPDTILTWKIMEKKFSWGIMILLGGGYGMAKGVTESGLSDWLGGELIALSTLSPIALLCISITLVTFMTEFTSNVACATIVIPIMSTLAQSLSLNPLYTMLPIACSCSFAFMLPVATPPNAIVFASGLLKVTDMIFAGFIMSCISIAVLTLNMFTYATWLLHLHTYPSWAPLLANVTTTAMTNVSTTMA